VNAFRESGQEVRREEKNLFLYHEADDQTRLLRQLDAAERALVDGRRAFDRIATDTELKQAAQLLREYRSQLQTYVTLSGAARIKQQQSIRSTGRELSELAEQFSRRERTVLAEAVNTAGLTLLSVFLTVLLLGIGSAVFLVRRVVRPLRDLEHQLDDLAEGHYQQLSLPSKDQEIQSFVHHFNSMLAKLRDQQNQLRHHEKAAALGVLVSGVAHELNNPLSNISTSVQLLIEDGDAADPRLREQWLTHIDDESERARRIVRRLLDSVRQPKLHVQAIPVRELIDSSCDLINRHLPPGVQIEVGDVADIELWADRERMHQVFINLIKNAADAGAKRIIINASETDWTNTLPASTDHLVGEVSAVSHAAKLLYLTIDDDGPGIEPEHLKQIFNPFFTTHSAGDGTGLGLYLVEEIISEHNGCIMVENRPRGGTRFTLWLPLPSSQEAA
jgi:signal transduction histidine kinase